MSEQGDVGQQSKDAEDWQAMKDARDTKINNQIAKALGPEALDNVTSSTDQISQVVKQRLLQIKADGGDSDKFLSVMREFSNALYARLNSVNLKPEVATTAIEGATALLTPEPLRDFQPGAENAVSALRKRYSIADK